MIKTSLIQRLLWLFTIIIGVVLLDQSVKQIMVNWIGPSADSHRVELLGAFVAFEYLENRGAAFGMFQQSTSMLAVLSAIIVCVGVVVMIRFAIGEFWLAAAVALILGGAIGNAIDRFARGFVVDFIAIGRFWKFNLADSAVTIGAALTFVLLWRAETAAKSSTPVQEQDV